ncbi:hypothetical protein [Ectobacillus polymachus]|uniref:hypothetical protein n=1 Tax=Ectobacillus polymachus TaxID=1508806 RepID=UPI003A8A19C8
MVEYFIDVIIVAVLVIGLTATNGIIVNGIGEKLFGGRKHREFIDQSAKTQIGWNSVGGKGIYKKHTY